MIWTIAIVVLYGLIYLSVIKETIEEDSEKENRRRKGK